MLLVIGHNGVLLLVAGNDYLDALLQVGLGGKAASVTDGAEGSLVDDVGQLGAGGTGGHTGDLVEVHVLGDLDLFGVYLQNGLAPQQVGQLHGYTAVETTGSGQGRIKGFGTVGGGQNDDAGVALEAVHLGEQLVQRLLALVVAAVLAAAALLADGVDLINEHDAGGFLLGLLEQVAHLGRAHAHEHLHEFGAGHGEEGHVGLAGHSLGQHGLARARRAHQQHALRHGRADLLIFAGIVEVVDDLRQVLLGLVLAGHIGKLDALGGLDVDLGVGLAHIEHQGVAAAHFLHQAAGDDLTDGDKDHQRQDPAQDIRQQGSLLDLLAGGGDAGVQEPLHQAVVRHDGGLVDGFAVGGGKEDAVALLLDLHLADLILLGHGDEGVVVHLLDLVLRQPGHGQQVEQQHQQYHDHVVVDQRFLGGFDLVHGKASLFCIAFFL